MVSVDVLWLKTAVASASLLHLEYIEMRALDRRVRFWGSRKGESLKMKAWMDEPRVRYFCWPQRERRVLILRGSKERVTFLIF